MDQSDNSAFWIALAACLVMVVLVWPRQMSPAWKYDKTLVCDYSRCVTDRTIKHMESPGSDSEYLRAKILEMTKPVRP